MHRILYVDDEPSLLEIAKLFLEHTNDFSVDVDTSAQHALHTLDTQVYDAIIADYQMPEMDGIAFLKSVRSKHGGIPFILFTGRGREEIVIQAINNGADFYLQKGGDPTAQFAELAHKLRQAIARNQAEVSLIESQKRLTDIINFLPDATFAIDRSGNVISWNRAIEEMTGISAANMLGKGEYEYAIPFYGTRRPILINLIFERDEKIDEHYANILHEKDMLIAETSLPRPKGRSVILMGKASPLYNPQGEIIGAIESIRDITELRKVEEVRFHAKKEWETIFRAIGHPAIVLDADNHIIDANDATLTVTGKSMDELRGKRCYEVFHNPDAANPPESCPFEQLKKSGTIKTAEIEIEALNGYYHVSCTPVFDTAGRLEKVIHIAMDISERRRAQDELRAAYEQLTASEEELQGQFDELMRSEQRMRESEAKYRELAELLPQMVFEMDLNFQITYANQHGLSEFGLTLEDIDKGVNALSCIHPAQHHVARLALEDISRGKMNYNPEYTAIRKDGSSFPALIYTAPVYRNGALIGFRGVLINISERKNAENALLESEMKYRNLAENTADILFSVDNNGTITYLSPQVARFGFGPEELVGKSFFTLIHPDDRESVISSYSHEMKTGENKSSKFRVIDKSGNIHWLEERSAIQLDKRRQPLGLQGVIRDITVEKAAQDMLRDSEERYRTLVDISPYAIIIHQEGKIIFLNRAAVELIGGSEAKEILGKNVLEFVRPEFQDAVRNNIHKDIDGDISPLTELQMLRLDGTSINVEGRGVRTTVGGKPAIQVTLSDISKRKQAEETLRESEMRFRSLFERSAEPQILLDSHGKVSDCNDALLALFALTDKKVIIGHGPEEFAPPYQPDGTPSPERGTQILREVMRTGSARYDWAHMRHDPDHTLVLTELFCTLITIASRPMIHVAIWDITERKKNEAKARTLIETTGTGFVILDSQGNVLDANPEYVRFTGYKNIDDIIGKSVIEWTASYEKKRNEEAISRCLKDGYIRNFEVDYTDSSGKIIPVEINATILRLGDSVQILTLCRDISERRRQQIYRQQLSALKEELIGTASLEKKLKRITDSIIDIFGVDFARIWIAGPGDLCEKVCIHAPVSEGPHVCHNRTSCLHLIASSGRYTHIDGGHRRVPLGAYKIGKIASGEEEFFITNDVTSDPRVHDHTWAASLGLVSFAGFRLVSAEGTPIGVLAFFSRLPVTPDLIDIFKDLAATVSQVIRTGFAERDLAESEEKYRTLVEHSQNGVFIIQDERLVFYNRALADMGGYNNEELIGRSISDLIAPEDRETTLSRYQERVSGKRATGSSEFSVLHKDGTTRVRVRMYAGMGTYKGTPAVIGTFQNVTEDRKREDAIRESEERYRSLFENNHAVMLLIDPETSAIMDANPAACNYYGWSHEDLVHKRIDDINILTSAEILAEMQLARTQQRNHFFFKHRLADGSIHDVEVYSAPIKYGGRSLLYSIIFDITDRKRAEEALRMSEEQYRMLVEHNRDGVFIIQEGRLVFYNQGLAGLTGYSAEELHDRLLSDLVAPEDREMVVTRAQERAKGRPVPEMYEFSLLHKDGVSRTRIRVRAGLGVYKGKPASIGTFYDITEDRKRENALRDSEQRLLLALDGGELGTWNWNLKTGEIIYNQRWADMLGYRLEEIEPHIRSWERIVHPDDMPRVQEILTAHLEGKTEKYECEHRLLHKSGSWIWVLDKGRVIKRDEDGRPLIAAGTHLDITQRKHAEELVHSLAQFPAENPHPVLRISSNGTLLYANNPGNEWLKTLQENEGAHLPDSIQSIIESAMNEEGVYEIEMQNRSCRIYNVTAIRPVGENYVNIYVFEITERKQAEKIIKETNKKINLLNSITRHDVKNQVAVLRGYAKIAMMKKPDPVIVDLLEKIDETGSVITRQIEFTKEYQELGMHDPDWYRISEIAAQQKHEDISLSCTCNAEILADPMLEKVFFNLIDNASRHGERVTSILISCNRDPEGLVIAVEDNGVGIPLDLKEKIFQKGYGKHTGFGLFLAREILAITGISIHETGMYGKGARFEIIVPEGKFRRVT